MRLADDNSRKESNKPIIAVITTPKQSTCAMKAKKNAVWVQEMFQPILSAVMSNQAHSQWKATLDARRLPAHQLRWRSQERSAKVLAPVVQKWLKLSTGYKSLSNG